MNEYLLEIEKGKKILRENNINLTAFKAVMYSKLENAHQLNEDDWVMYYNDYASCVGRTGLEPLPEWVQEFFKDLNKKEHRIWLRK